MKKWIMVFAGIGLLIIIIFLIFSYRTINSELKPDVEKKWVYIPMVYVNNNLYFDRGNVIYSIPDGWKYYGSIVKQIPQTQRVIKEELCSNDVKVGSRVYLNKKNLNKIYIEIKLDEKIIYLEYKNE